jgi:O-antigen ligase
LEHVTERSAFQVNEIEARINIWYSALQEPEDYIWHGVGVGCNSEYLTPVYDSLHWDKFKKRQFNAHNQYLGILINLGIFAALFFLLTWLLLPIWHKGRVRQFATLIALTIGLNMLTENMLDRIDGVIVTSVSMLVIALLSRVQLEK